MSFELVPRKKLSWSNVGRPQLTGEDLEERSACRGSMTAVYDKNFPLAPVPAEIGR